MTKITRELKSEIVHVFHECFTEDLTNKLCKIISEQLEKKIEVLDRKLVKIDILDSKFTEVNDSLANLDKLDGLVKQIEGINDCIKSISKSVCTSQKEVVGLNKYCDYIHQTSKKNSLRFYGFEENDGEDPVEMISLFISKNLNVSCTMQDIDCAFRVGRISNNEGKGRAILVNFVNSWKRSQILSHKRSLKSSGISMFEDLTKLRHELLAAAKKKYGKSQAWSAGGKIYALCNGKKILLSEERSERFDQ